MLSASMSPPLPWGMPPWLAGGGGLGAGGGLDAAGGEAGAEFGVGVEVAVEVVGAAMEVVAGGGGGGGARTMNESAARTPLSPTSVTTRWCEPGARSVNVTCVEPCRGKRPSST